VNLKNYASDPIIFFIGCRKQDAIPVDELDMEQRLYLIVSKHHVINMLAMAWYFTDKYFYL